MPTIRVPSFFRSIQVIDPLRGGVRPAGAAGDAATLTVRNVVVAPTEADQARFASLIRRLGIANGTTAADAAAKIAGFDLTGVSDQTQQDLRALSAALPRLPADARGVVRDANELAFIAGSAMLPHDQWIVMLDGRIVTPPWSADDTIRIVTTAGDHTLDVKPATNLAQSRAARVVVADGGSTVDLLSLPLGDESRVGTITRRVTLRNMPESASAFLGDAREPLAGTDIGPGAWQVEVPIGYAQTLRIVDGRGLTRTWRGAVLASPEALEINVNSLTRASGVDKSAKNDAEKSLPTAIDTSLFTGTPVTKAAPPPSPPPPPPQPDAPPSGSDTGLAPLGSQDTGFISPDSGAATLRTKKQRAIALGLQLAALGAKRNAILTAIYPGLLAGK